MASQQPASPQRQANTGREAPRRACDSCKRRKVRCTGEIPCQNCVRHASRCYYTAAHGRVAHAERRVHELQSRLELFQKTWSRYLPQVELSAAIEECHKSTPSSTGIAQHETIQHHKLADTANEKASIVNDTDEIRVSPKTGPTSASPEDSEYEEADTLDWDESLVTSSVADGFASLSTKWKGIGYMGPTTGNTLLRKLQSLSMLYLSAVGDATVQSQLEPTLPEVDLTTSAFISQCVDWYFRYYHPSFPILHEGSFRAQLMGAVPKPQDGSWPILLNVVLALGALSGPSCSLNADMIFQRDASSHLSWNLLQRGTLSLVQALGLLASYLQKRNKPNSGFVLLGIAMSMAQAVGLHRDLCGPATTVFTMEIRRRVWWTLFVLDAEMRLTFGRPTLKLGGVSTKMPRNLDDADLAVDMDKLPMSQEYPTVTSSLIWQAELAKISNAANEKLVEKHVPSLPLLLALGQEVDRWTETLPTYISANPKLLHSDTLVAPRIILLWRAIHLRIVIHRPYLLRRIRQKGPLEISQEATAVAKCVRAADEMISPILMVWSSPKDCHGLLAWYSCYFLVTAVFVHISCLLYEPHNASAMHWRQQIEDSESALKQIGTFEPTALSAATILHQIMRLVPTNPDSALFETNEPIRIALAGMWNMSWNDLTSLSEPLPSGWLVDGDLGFDHSPTESQPYNA